MSEKPLEMGTSKFLRCPEEPEWTAVAPNGENEKNSSNTGGWMYNRCRTGRQNGKPG